MNRDVGAYRVTETRQFGPNLEWDALPELGMRERHNYRAIGWRWIIAGTLGFWIAVAWWASQ